MCFKCVCVCRAGVGVCGLRDIWALGCASVNFRNGRFTGFNFINTMCPRKTLGIKENFCLSRTQLSAGVTFYIIIIIAHS